MGLFIFLTVSVAHLAADFFTNRGIDESVVFHLVYGLKGAGFSEYSTLISLTITALIASVAIVFGVFKAGQRGIRQSWLIHPSVVILTLSIMTHSVIEVFSQESTHLVFSEKFEDYFIEPDLSRKKLITKKILF